MSDEPNVPTVEEVTPDRPRRAHRIRAGVLIGVLTALLGFAIAVQVQANSQSDSLAGLREDDLIGILDNQNARADRLRQQISELQRSLRSLQQHMTMMKRLLKWIGTSSKATRSTSWIQSTTDLASS